MSRGKHLSLEEARRFGKIDRFAKEHQSVGDRKRFAHLLDAMVHGEPPASKKKQAKEEASSAEHDAGSSGTQTLRGT